MSGLSKLASAGVVVLCSVTGLTALPRFIPARYAGGGALPTVSPNTVAGGEVLLEVRVGRNGAAAATTTLRATPPFTNALAAAVRGWRFQPAVEIAGPQPGELSPRASFIFKPYRTETLASGSILTLGARG